MNPKPAYFIFPFIFLFLSGVWLMGQEDAREVFTRATDQLLTGQMELSMDVVVVDKQGREKAKAYDILMGSFGEVEKMRMVMQKPERAKGVTIIVTSQPDSTGLIEVYTPANGKIRKMEATPENMERVGSNFYMSSYDSDDLEKMDITMLEPTELDGEPCYQLEVRDAENEEGGGARFLITQDSYKIRQIRILDEKGRQSNVTSLDDYMPVEGMEGKIQPMRITAENLNEKTLTRVTVHQVHSRPELSEEEFNIESCCN